MNNKKKMMSVISSLVVMGIAIMFLVYSLQYPFEGIIGPGPAVMPFCLSLILLVLSVPYLITALRGKDSVGTMPDVKGLFSILQILVFMALYVVLLKPLGTVLAGIVFLFLLYRKSYRWYVALGISAVVSIALFVVFRILLEVNLPINAFGF